MPIPPYRKPFLATVAILFAAVTLLYSVLFALYGNEQMPVELGFDNDYQASDHSQLVKSVYPGSPAEAAGIKPGDHIIAINGTPPGEETLAHVWAQSKPGQRVELKIQRPGVASPLLVQGIFRTRTLTSEETGVAQHVGRDIIRLFPFVFLTVGMAVLFLRLEDPNAWLLALMFGGFIAVPNFNNDFMNVPASLRPLALGYRGLFDNILPSLFYFFFAVFPTRSPMERRAPWLKWLGLAGGLFLAVPVGLAAPIAAAKGIRVRQLLPILGGRYGHLFVLIFNYGLITLGFVSLTWNALTVESAEARRKIRVILLGTLMGVIPATVSLAANDFFGFNIGVWLGATIVLLLWLFPVSFAYAVVKHRVLEIPVLLKRSARFLMVQWGVHIVGVVATFALVLLLGRIFAKEIAAHPQLSVIPAVGLGAIIMWSAIVVGERINKRIDRAFFRSSYDARLILENLAEQTRLATTRQQLATLLQEEIREALHPQAMVMYQSTGNGELRALGSETLEELQAVPADLPLLIDLERNGHPWEAPPPDSEEASTWGRSLLAFAPLQPECFVPMRGRDSKLAGLLVLGTRLSEEPYSREDRRLLASVASQAGVALEGIGLTEKIAERMEAERRSRHELEMARQVQARLFPQKLPSLRTLEFVGSCTQARQVGGDYYDFLELAPGRLGLLLADIAGKGFSGALLMANLQANLRSQYATAIDDLPRLLSSVNRLFYESTDSASYATLFLADYDDATNRLRYANCGHLPALVVRADSRGPARVDRLQSTCTVMGLFESWQCEIAEAELNAGDLLVLYTDGVTEAENSSGQEFGESRLVETLRRHAQLPLELILKEVVSAVQEFGSGHEQQDDITLVMARGVD